MSSETSVRIAVILLFAITFAVIGSAAPVLYATNVPQNQIIDVHEFDADDTTTNSDSHYVCFDRTVKYSTSAKVFTELYLVDKDGERVEVQSETMYRYLQEGRTEVVSIFTLPEKIAAGEYQYILVLQMNMADGRVTRDLVFNSNTFAIDNGDAEPIGDEPDC